MSPCSQLLVRTLPALARRLAAACLPALLAGALAAQELPPTLHVETPRDTGSVANGASQANVVIAFGVSWPGAESLRLYFDAIELAGDVAAGTASVLRITSLKDGAVQTLDALQCRQWQNSTAYFNGDALLVEVLAQPRTGSNRLRLGSLDAGLGWSAPKSQCGPLDDRVLSSDPRMGRLMPVACTAWMISDCGHCFLTAGHCVGFINVMQFNVPPSTAGGALQNPPPQDQYAVDQASIQSNGGQGVGNDFAYFGCMPNTQTGLTPMQAQGSAFDLVSPPAPAGNTIRITGYGTDSTPPSANQVQQTSIGPFTSSFGTTLQYQADSQGGNSGSPVVWEEEDKAIGIHTHAGCGFTGGANQGTSILLGSLQAVLADPHGVCSSSCAFSDLGQGLAGSVGVPHLTGSGSLQPSTQVSLTLANVPFLSTTTLVVGFAPLGAPFKGGVMVPETDVLISGLSTGLGFVVFPFTWPAGMPSGFSTWYQFWTADAGAVQGFSASNALLSVSP